MHMRCISTSVISCAISKGGGEESIGVEGVVRVKLERGEFCGGVWELIQHY